MSPLTQTWKETLCRKPFIFSNGLMYAENQNPTPRVRQPFQAHEPSVALWSPTSWAAVEQRGQSPSPCSWMRWKRNLRFYLQKMEVLPVSQALDRQDWHGSEYVIMSDPPSWLSLSTPICAVSTFSQDDWLMDAG